MINPSSPSPVVTGNSIAKKERVGELEVEYAVLSSTSSADVMAAATPVVTIIDGLLWQFFRQIAPWALVV
ncbi:hypothetical protein ABIC60_003731 [Phyllobacterium ifriqiyense]